ncbi:hypothetical protein [Candidatus Mycolicibacterium alkanivorans]|uniref:hypothetical protein n=1 Tax=Candidatus Mycolicibacterium alkanivorans TaxID=2954114 RepID=UPI0035578C73
MTRTSTTRATTAILLAALSVSVAACDSQSGVPGATSSAPAVLAPIATTSTTTKATASSAAGAAPSVDFTRLLLQARDISTAEDSYTAQPATANPDGRPGAEVLLVNQDQTKAVDILIAGLPDPATAPAALQEAQVNLANTVTGGQPQPSPVGAGGTMVSGTSPDGKKSVTVLLFTEGAALARVEFDGVPGQPASSAFVTDTGQKQDIALRVGLGAPATTGG